MNGSPPEMSLGTDIVAIKRIASLLTRWPVRAAKRIFTAREITYCQSRKNRHEHFAARFAAKEALIKALNVDSFKLINLREIEVKKQPNGAPYFKVSGQVASLVAERSVRKINLSLSHCREYALAVVLLEKE